MNINEESIYQDKVELLKYQIKELEKRKQKLQTETKNLELSIESGKKLWSEIVSIENLDLLKNYVTGKITHYVVLGGYYPVDVVKSNERSGEILSLIYGSNGDLYWKVSYYETNKGKKSKESRICMPCLSYEEAVNVAQKEMMAWIKRDYQYDNITEYNDNLISRAKRLGIVLPDEFYQRAKKQKLNKLNEAAKKEREKFERQLGYIERDRKKVEEEKYDI